MGNHRFPRNDKQHQITDIHAYVVRTPRKTVGPVSDKIWGTGEAGEAGIATTSVFRELDWDYSGN